jgi:hypothetical protein
MSLRKKANKLISNRAFIVVLFVLFSVGASFQSLTGTKTYEDGGVEYNKYNNYTIFERSFEHLKNEQDLYQLYPEEQWDLYKYTPTFSVFFGFFWLMPHWLGLNLWNLLNTLIVLGAIYFLPKLTNYQKGIIALIILIELLTSLQNAQSNGLMAGLILLALGFLERERYFPATFSVLSSVFVKLFGIVAFAFFLFFPKKIKLAGFTVLGLVLLLLPPLIFIDLEQYQSLLTSYLSLLNDDHQSSHGYSVMGVLQTWFNVHEGKNLVLVLGALLFLVPFSRISMYKNYIFKYLTVCSVLLWIVIFNHKAESPTFIIAMTGVALWFVISKKNALNITLFALAFVFTTLSSTDLFPKFIRSEYFHPYAIKAVPCILIWFKIIYDLMTLKVDNDPFAASDQQRSTI